MHSKLFWIRAFAGMTFFILFTQLYAKTSKEFFDLGKLKKGQKGYAETVFEGTEPEKFDIEVLGLWKDVYPSIDIVLIKCTGEKIAKAHIAHGMSGSPVYIDNKKLGAIAISFDGKDIDIAGVTPIQAMFKQKRTNDVANLYDTIYYEGTHLSPKNGLVTTASSNFSKNALALLNKTWKSHALGEIIDTPGGYEAGLPESLNYKIKAGSMIGVSLVKGQFSMTAFGTVTDVEDNSFVGFGHPFLGLGSVEFPVFNAYTYIVLPTTLTSNKLVGLGKEIGVMTGDYITGVNGNFNKRAKLIPVNISVHQKSKNIDQKASFEVISHRDLSTNLIYAVTQSLIDATLSYASHNLVHAKLSFSMDGIQKPFEYDMSYYQAQNPLSKDLMFIPEVLIQNPYRELKLTNLSLDISIENEKRVSIINKIWLNKPLSKDEENYTLFIELLEYNKNYKVLSQRIKIPTAEISGPLEISASSGSQVPPFEYPNTYKEFINFVRTIYGPQDLVVTVTYQKQGLRLEGNELQNLPQSAYFIYERQNRLKLTQINEKQRFVLKQQEVILGNQLIELEMEKAHSSRQKQEGNKK